MLDIYTIIRFLLEFRTNQGKERINRIFRRTTNYGNNVTWYAATPGNIWSFNDAWYLYAVAERARANMEEMEGISGIGVVKLREFGKVFLKEIQAYLAENPSADK